jgi:hypothetical protein
MGPYFIDFEAFQHGSGTYKIKELCIIDVDRPLSPLYFVFSAPKRWSALTLEQQKTFEYETTNLHGLHWDEGTIRYCRRCIWYWIKTTFPHCRNTVFYVMGKQKMDFLQQEFSELKFCEYNITLHNLPYLPPNIKCLYREHDLIHCACLKCYRLFQHYICSTD